MICKKSSSESNLDKMDNKDKEIDHQHKGMDHTSMMENDNPVNGNYLMINGKKSFSGKPILCI